MPEPHVIQTAHRHGIDEEDMFHAMRNVMWLDESDDEGLMMWIGPSRSAKLLEIGVVDGEEGPVIIHAMNARDKFLYGR